MNDRDANSPQIPLESLTRREREVLALLAEGLTGPEIAERLMLATSSVKTHMQHVYGKLGVNGKRQAVKRARELGLLTPDPGLAQSVSPLPPVEPPRPKHNLPVQVTRFFGREDEIASLIQRLTEHRLVTLTGSGGVGKTRLSLQAAEALVDQFSGVWLVELAALTDPALVLQHVAATLGLREDPNRSPLEDVRIFLRGRQVLLVLDNCEHLLDACAQFVAALLHDSSNLKVLASSREPLGIPGEAVFGVRSLSFPDPAHLPPFEQLSDYTAIRLFVDRARLVVDDYQVMTHNALPLARICQRLDGIPLAIEMAAARINVLSAASLAERLDDAFRVLTGGSRTALPRQQTLRAAMDWSYELLSGAERQLLQRLSVFAGGCTLEAAEAVCADPLRGEELDVSPVLDVLASLAAKSMVIADRRQSEETRYRLLEMVRQYARERLREAPSQEAEIISRQHLAYFLALAERAGEELDRGFNQVVWLDRLESELDNLRTALSWSLKNSFEAGARLATALGWFWHHRAYRKEGSEWLERALVAEARERGEAPLVPARALSRVNVLRALAYMRWNTGEKQIAIPLFEECLALLKNLGPTVRPRLPHMLKMLAGWAVEQGNYTRAEALKAESLSLLQETEEAFSKAEVLNILAEFALMFGDFAGARPILEERLASERDAGALGGIIDSLWLLGNVAVQLGDDHQAKARYEEGLAVARELGARHSVNQFKSALSHIELRLGHYMSALALYAQTIVVWQELDRPAAVAHQLERFAFIARAQSQAHRAARLLGAAEALRESINSHMTDDERVEYNREVSTLRAQIEESAFTSAWAEGRAMTMEQAISEALSDIDF